MRWWIFCYWFEPDAPGDPVGLVRIWSLAETLVQAGDDVTLFPPRYRSALVPRAGRLIPIRLLPWPVLRPLSYAALSFVRGLLLGLRHGPDLVYYRWMASPHPLLLARVVGATCVCEVNGEPVPDWSARSRGLVRTLTHAVARWTLPRCDRVVVLTEGLKDLLIRRYGVRVERITVVPSGTDTRLFAPRSEDAARRELGLPVGLYVGFVGSLYRYQGLSCLLDAMVLVKEAYPAVQLVLVGDGEVADELKEQAARLGLTSSIRWVGRVSYAQVPAWIGAMTVCVAPFRGDRGETSPVKLFDYLACGRPVVASAIPSVTGLFGPDSGVQLVPPDQPRPLADAIIGLLRDHARRAVLGAEGRRFVEQRFSWIGLVDRLRSGLVVNQLTGHHASARLL